MNPDETFGYDVDPDEAVSDPIGLLRSWLARCDGSVTPLMTLSTIDEDGYPDSRHVLLSRCDAEGRIAFHTDARSRKAAQLRAIPRASVAVVWPGLARQLVVTGDVGEEDPSDQTDAYGRRPRYLQLLAWLNDEDTAGAVLAQRREAWASFDAGRAQLAAPPTWLGRLLTPRRIVFWRGEADAPSNRVLCTRTDAGWSVVRRPG
ncbi:pyridoxamine 5'-phosphate oxidase family protein [Nocardioides sp. BP30]|uniref:pyridoxamine 5'-phosphate oxidase family protein n=1 Tax=Nocardioides sp. BP30 TaxID=3036374 RepID=UPI0024685D6F|nr:pyridoxamine 5'-phosphate oxidase family protein [Nocardioides sp. BP30]WGL52621.1 pyridoxamine 5'-phosphate oxidase family protein [Nocardioides sp. BP30]